MSDYQPLYRRGKPPLSTGQESGCYEDEKFTCPWRELNHNRSDVTPSVYRLPTAISRKFQIIITSGSVVVKALCYKPEGRGFETR
jgi:hypothetical protein